jgi:hypothetical protein
MITSKDIEKVIEHFGTMEPLYDKILYFGFSSPSLQIAEGLD